jgi:hypothetical protein
VLDRISEGMERDDERDAVLGMLTKHFLGCGSVVHLFWGWGQVLRMLYSKSCKVRIQISCFLPPCRSTTIQKLPSTLVSRIEMYAGICWFIRCCGRRELDRQCSKRSCYRFREEKRRTYCHYQGERLSFLCATSFSVAEVFVQACYV